MPELPEVEVVKKSLEDKLKYLTIKSVFINNNKLRYKINNKEFYKIKGRKITSIQRRSKYLLINLDKDLTILVHFGMTGKFFIVDSSHGLIRQYYDQVHAGMERLFEKSQIVVVVDRSRL